MTNISESQVIRPITPEEALDTKEFPASIIQAVNELILMKATKRSFSIKQKDIISLACKIDHHLERNKIFPNGWMDFEHLFEDAGWNVGYEKPDYTENFDAYYTFESKHKT